VSSMSIERERPLLGHAGLGHAELGQCYWDALLGQRDWDSGTGTCGTGTALLGHAILGHFFVIRVYKMVEILRWYAIIAATNTVESSR